MTVVAMRLDTESAAGEREMQHERVYRELREAIVFGRFVPGRPVTLRGVAEDLGTSLTPVREALRQLVAERALIMSDNRRVAVPTISPERFCELCRARILLEPELAAQALASVDKAIHAEMCKIDGQVDAALASGDIEGYMRANFHFHFSLYRLASSSVLRPFIDSLWLQVGPFLRFIVGQLGANTIPDRHEEILSALATNNEARLRDAIRSDVLDGQQLISAVLAAPDEAAIARFDSTRGTRQRA